MVSHGGPHGEYSGLEVTHAQKYYQALEVVPQELYSSPKEVVPSRTPLTSVVPPEGQPDDHAPPTELAEHPWRILGFSRRTFLLTCIAAIVIVVGATVGGVVGSLGSRRTVPGKSTSSQSTEAPTPTSNSTDPTPSTATSIYVHRDSKLAASNYSDSDGYTHRSVFFQDASLALIGRFWDSQNNTWETVNLTRLFPSSQILAGSPLTSSSLNLRGNRVVVWCLLEDQSIHSYTWNGNGDGPVRGKWVDDSSIGGTTRIALAGSWLASSWQRPVVSNSSSIGSWIVAFQNTNGELAVANYTGASTIAVPSTGIATPSSLAMDYEISGDQGAQLVMTFESNGRILKTAWPQLSSTWNTGKYLLSLELYSLDLNGIGEVNDAGQFVELMFPDTNAKYPIMTDLSADSSKLQLATTALLNPGQYLFLALLPNGVVTATLYKQKFLRIASVEFPGNPSVNISSIATTSDAILYGIFNDTILEYSINSNQPNTSTFMSFVYP